LEKPEKNEIKRWMIRNSATCAKQCASACAASIATAPWTACAIIGIIGALRRTRRIDGRRML
jgi:hypothetical protein